MRLLLRTTDPTLIAFAQALLSGEGIAAFEMDVHMSILGGSSFLLPRRLMVTERTLSKTCWRKGRICSDHGVISGPQPKRPSPATSTKSLLISSHPERNIVQIAPLPAKIAALQQF